MERLFRIWISQLNFRSAAAVLADPFNLAEDCPPPWVKLTSYQRSEDP